MPEVDWLSISNSIGDINNTITEFGIEAVIFSGGDDFGVTPRRDQFETALLLELRARELPVFGVCRGMQLLNNVFGGYCTRNDNSVHIATRHKVTSTPEFARRMRFTENEATWDVNSYHGYSITMNGMAEGFVPLVVS